MSVVFSVFAPSGELPTRAEWQAAIQRAGFELQLGPDFDPRMGEGFQPARYRGHESGFEYYVEPIALGGLTAAESQAATGMAVRVTFVLHSNLPELVSAEIAAGVLAELVGGCIYEDDDDQVVQSVHALEWARKAEREVDIRPDDPKKSPAQWAKSCLPILQGIDPTYVQNIEAKHNLIEFLRPHPSGLFISQNFIRQNGEYYLSFGLLFTSDPGASGLLLAGGRFDSHRTIGTLVQQVRSRRAAQTAGIWNHLRRLFAPRSAQDKDRGDERPTGVWDSSPWRTNTMKLLERGLRVPEEYLLPEYLGRLQTGAGNLERLFARAAELVPALLDAQRERLQTGHVSPAMRALARASDPHGPEERVDERAQLLDASASLGLNVQAIEHVRWAHGIGDALAIAAGGKCYRGSGPDSHRVDLDQLPLEAIVVNYLETFAREQGRLDELVAIARRLGQAQ